MDDVLLNDDEWYDVMMTHFERKGFLHGSVHGRLTPEERKLWAQFSEESRELILAARSTANPRVSAPSRRSRGGGGRGGDAFRSGQRPSAPPRVPNTPVAQGATANVTEQN